MVRLAKIYHPPYMECMLYTYISLVKKLAIQGFRTAKPLEQISPPLVLLAPTDSRLPSVDQVEIIRILLILSRSSNVVHRAP